MGIGGELRDDIALLVCQVVPDSTIGEPTRELVLPNEAARVAEVRAFVSNFLADLGRRSKHRRSFSWR